MTICAKNEEETRRERDFDYKIQPTNYRDAANALRMKEGLY